MQKDHNKTFLHLKDLILSIACLLAFPIFSQTIKVQNEATKKGIEGVFIYNKNQSKTALSDSLGRVNLTDFSKKDTLIFTHPSYATFSIQKINIGNVISLKEQALTIPTYEILATQEKNKALEVTSKIDKIAAKTVAFHNPQTAAEMLELTGSVYLQKSQMGGGSPIIRGFEANRVLLVVDGVRLNNAIYRSGHLQNAITIDNAIIENTNVIYGSNSVIYGSDAIGGVVHYETKSPLFKNNKDTIKHKHTNAYVRYATANQEKTGHFDFNLGGKKIAALTSITYSDFKDLRMGGIAHKDYPDFGIVKDYTERIHSEDVMIRKKDFTQQIGTAYSQLDVLEKISFKVSDNFLLTLNTQYSTSSDVPRYDQLTDFEDQTLKWAEWHYGPQNRLLGSLSAKVKANNKWFNKMEILAHYQKIDEDRISRKFGDDIRTTREEDVNVMGVNVDFVKFNTENARWYYGTEIIHNQVQSSAFAQNIVTLEKSVAATRYPDGGSTLSSAAAYASYKNKFTKEATYSFGSRYSFSTLSASFLETTFVDLPFSKIKTNNGALTGNAGLVYHPNKQWNVQLAISSAFRSPNVDDVGKVFAKRDFVMVPNDQLTPEYSYNGEVGVTRMFGEEDLTINVVGYYTYLKDAIVRSPYTLNNADSLAYEGEMLLLQTNKNATKAVVYGASINLKAKLSEQVDLSSSLNYTVGENRSLGVPFAHIPPLYGRTDFIINAAPLTMAIYIKYQGQKKIADYSPFGEDNEDRATVDGTPAWHTFNLRAAAQLSPSIALQAALENIMDVHYRPFASGISGAGRNFMFTLRASF